MIRLLSWRGAALGTLAGLLLATSGSAQVSRTPRVITGSGTTPARVTPRFELWAETKLLMDGLAQPNHSGLEKHLKDRPADNDTWTFIRGQALLLAETGNLLLLRPPRSAGRDTWYSETMEMRRAAGALARQAGRRDYSASQAALKTLTAACNRCHQTFRVPVRLGPEAERLPEPTPKPGPKTKPKPPRKPDPDPDDDI
jgi:hypothetical protein